MAVSSSLPLITLFFFLSLLAGNAVRDLPIISDINVSAGPLRQFVPVATLYLGGESSWSTHCFKNNRGSVRYDKVAIVQIQASGSLTTTSCTETYEFRVNTKIVARQSISSSGVPGGSSIVYTLSFDYEGVEADIQKYGVTISLFRGNGVEARNEMKESGIHIIKEVKEILETF